MEVIIVTPCRLVGGYESFGETYGLCLSERIASIFRVENGSNVFLQDDGNQLQDCMTPQTRIQKSIYVQRRENLKSQVKLKFYTF
jgi:hypothetical protein